jgi:nucleotide-binding universal stress UspA family protein/predicted transcriptional regulator
MFHHLLLATDGSERAAAAAEVALRLAELLHARLDVLSVEETAPRYVSAAEESQRERQEAFAYFDRLHQGIQQRANARHIPTTSAILSGHEIQTTLRYATEQGHDLLVIGAQGHSAIWQPFLGSTADKLINHAPCSVLIVRASPGKLVWKQCLVAFDGSPHSWRALQEGFALAQLLSASVQVISVGEGIGDLPPPRTGPLGETTVPSAGPDWQAYFRAIQERALSQARHLGLPAQAEMLVGHASSVLVATTQEHPHDVLILGSTGQEHPWSTTLGSTARKVANEAACSLLIVRPRQTQRRVRDLMRTEVATVTSQTPLSEVVHHLIEQGTRLLVVVDQARHVLGIITLSTMLAYDQAFQRLDLRQGTDPVLLEEALRHVLQTTRVAGEMMNRHPFLLRETATVEEAARWMESRHLTRIPVIDEHHIVVGLLDQADLLRHYLDLPPGDAHAPAETPAQAASMQMVGDAAVTPVPLVPAQLPLPDVLAAVQGTPHRRVIVVDTNGKALGVIAERDILAACGVTTRRNPLVALAGRFAWTMPQEWIFHRATSGPLVAGQVMRPTLFSVTPTTSLADALRLMLAQRITRLVVIDEQGKPLGLTDRQHVLRALLDRTRSSGSS